MRFIVFFSTLGFLTLTTTAAIKDGVMLITSDETAETEIRGVEALAYEAVPPASTFKVLLAWAGLNSGVWKSSDLIPASDRRIPGSPKRYSLKQALYYSSNEFFIPWSKKIGKERLTQYLNLSGIWEKEIEPSWLAGGWSTVKSGGSLKVTPEQNHAWMMMVAKGDGLGMYRDQFKDFHDALEWPCSDSELRLFGKTGVWGGAVWFNGFGRSSEDKTTIVTVFLKGSLERRNEAISLFYDHFDQSPPDQNL
ncbi:MAG: penicillin-binding transpeptidase domain-containing protein [Verrucomicrobiota bacterium]